LSSFSISVFPLHEKTNINKVEHLNTMQYSSGRSFLKYGMREIRILESVIMIKQAISSRLTGSNELPT
jgi:hypothetical protein